MELHSTAAKRLVAIEQELGPLSVSPAEAAVIHRVIAATGDFELGQALEFSSDALKSGAAALASRSAIVADIPAVQMTVQPRLQNCFANRVCCMLSEAGQSQEEKASSQSASSLHQGLEVFSQRYPNAIYVIGQMQSAIAPLQDLILKKAIYPALVIITSPNLEGNHPWLANLQKIGVPYIVLTERRGNAMVAIAILEALIDITWQIYDHEARNRHH